MNDTISNLQIVSCTKSNLESPHRTQTRKSIEIAQMLNTLAFHFHHTPPERRAAKQGSKKRTAMLPETRAVVLGRRARRGGL